MYTLPGDRNGSGLGGACESGVRAVLDFAPVRVSSPPEVQVRQVDLSGELMCLSFRLNRDDEKR